MSDHQADYPIATMCRLLGVSSSGYHAWVKRCPSQDAETDAPPRSADRGDPCCSHSFPRQLRSATRACRTCRQGYSGWLRAGCAIDEQAGPPGVSRRKFVGLEGFLMHLARAVECPAVIVFGGRSAPWQLGYVCNINIHSTISCAPCWRSNDCEFGRQCMHGISAADVIAAAREMIRRPRNPLAVETVAIATAGVGNSC